MSGAFLLQKRLLFLFAVIFPKVILKLLLSQRSF